MGRRLSAVETFKGFKKHELHSESEPLYLSLIGESSDLAISQLVIVVVQSEVYPLNPGANDLGMIQWHLALPTGLIAN